MTEFLHAGRLKLALNAGLLCGMIQGYCVRVCLSKKLPWSSGGKHSSFVIRGGRLYGSKHQNR